MSGTDPAELKIHGQGTPFPPNTPATFFFLPLFLSHILSGKAKLHSRQKRTISFFILIFPFFFFYGDHLGVGRGKEALEHFRHNNKKKSMIKTKKHKQTNHVAQNNDFGEKRQKNCISFWSVAGEENRESSLPRGACRCGGTAAGTAGMLGARGEPARRSVSHSFSCLNTSSGTWFWSLQSPGLGKLRPFRYGVIVPLLHSG